MSHIVIHDTVEGEAQYHQFNDLGPAVVYVEQQRNAGVESVKLFEMREIALEVKSYFKVEIAGADEAPAAVEPAEEPTPEPAPVAEAVAAEEPAPIEEPPVAVPDSVATAMDDVSYVEAGMASPIEAFATEAPPLSEFAPSEDPMPTEGRRGLFGR